MDPLERPAQVGRASIHHRSVFVVFLDRVSQVGHFEQALLIERWVPVLEGRVYQPEKMKNVSRSKNCRQRFWLTKCT